MSAPFTDHLYTAAVGFMHSRVEGVLGTISGGDLRGDNQMILATLWKVSKVVVSVAFVFALGRAPDGAQKVLEPNMDPTWVDFGAMLEPFWTIFWCWFGFST